MKKLVAGLFGLAVLAVIIGIGAISVSSSTTSGETSRIGSYVADFDVKADGDLTVVETLTVDFPVSRRGIFRFFDTRDNPNGSQSRVLPNDIQVTRDGVPEPFDKQTQSRGRYVVLKIGRADTLLDGEHVYRIGYTVPSALSPGSGGHRTQFYWDLIPSGWEMPIAQSRLTVHLPAAAQGLKCAVGVGAGSGACQASGAGTETLTIDTGSLSPHTPVTVQAGLDMPTPAVHTLPWSSRLDPVLGRHPALLGLVLLLAVLAGAGGFLLTRSTKEKTPAFPLMYAPPDGVGPAQAAYLLTEKIEDKAFVATMMYAAEKGAVQLSQDGRTWTITGTGEAAWGGVDEVTSALGQSLGVITSGASFAASPKSVTAGQTLKTALASFRSGTKGWARTAGLMTPSGLGGLGLVVLLVTWGLTVWLGAFNPLNMSVLALVPGAFAVFGLGVGMSGAGTKRTPAGRDLWSRIGGFKRILSTPSAEDRFDFSGRKELYTAYLPWAVAFDCADAWEKKYRLETGEEPPVPAYFVGYTGANTGNYVNQMVNSFDSAVSSAVSSYEATQRSSSSGGGGFSGGGGGGGGGGGSW